MNQFNEEDIGKLLRLKRHEQPPPGYFDNFLHEFHRRQCDELLREPVWRICLQRAQDFMFRLNVPTFASYPAVVTALVVCAAVLSLKFYQDPTGINVAAQSPAPVVATALPSSGLNLSNPVTSRDIGPTHVRSVKNSSHTHRAAAAPPRYVLDSTPVSHEAAFRF